MTPPLVRAYNNRERYWQWEERVSGTQKVDRVVGFFYGDRDVDRDFGHE